MTDKHKIIEKIKKLLALSKSDNQHEAELAAERANDLMTKYHLSFTEIDLTELKSEKITEELVPFPMKRKWIIRLARACAKLFDGEVLIFSGRRTDGLTFVGYSEDIEAMKNMFDHLYGSWKSFSRTDARAMRNEVRDAGGLWTRGDGIRFKQSHGVAFSQTIFQRCIKLVRERQEVVAQASSTGRELVVVKDHALKDYGQKQGWRSGRAVSIRSSSSYGAAAGRTAGNAASLGGAIDSRSSGRAITNG